MTETRTHELLPQALRPALWGSLALSAALGVGVSTAWAWGFLAGALWNLANLCLLQALALAWGREQRRKALLLLLTKLLILYPVGLAMALSGKLSLVALLAGFSWPFVVLVICAAWPKPAAPSASAEAARV